MMAEQDKTDEDATNYMAPAEKSVNEILNLDTEDESLRKYKETLLGSTVTEVFPDDPRRVVVQKLALLVDGQADMELDLTQSMAEVKKNTFTLKEGCQYKVKIYFYVQREIVSGLKYVQKSYRKGLQVDKTSYMVGSYGPKMELQSFTSPLDEAPSGLISRGTYSIKSLFTDDDKNEHLKWEWSLEIKKDWK